MQRAHQSRGRSPGGGRGPVADDVRRAARVVDHEVLVAAVLQHHLVGVLLSARVERARLRLPAHHHLLLVLIMMLLLMMVMRVGLRVVTRRVGIVVGRLLARWRPRVAEVLRLLRVAELRVERAEAASCVGNARACFGERSFSPINTVHVNLTQQFLICCLPTEKKTI